MVLLIIIQTCSPATGIQRRIATPGRKCLNSLSRGFQRSAVRCKVLVYLSQILAAARKNKRYIPYHCFIYYFSCIFSRTDRKSGQPSAGYKPTRSPKRSCRHTSADASATTHPGKRSSPVSSAILRHSAWMSMMPAEPAGKGPRAGETVHGRDAGRLVQKQTRVGQRCKAVLPSRRRFSPPSPP